MTDKVSIITPLYNCGSYLEETILSVQRQTYANWELVIIDDASDDNSGSIVQNFMKKDERIKLITLTANSGPAKARNAGLMVAQGRFIAFLDSDDLWHETKLETQVAFMLRHNCALSCTDYYEISEFGGKVLRQIRMPERITYQQMLASNMIGCLTAMYDSKAIGKLFMPDVRRHQDYALWLRILRSVPYAGTINKALGYYRVRRSSISKNKIAGAFYHWNIYRCEENLSFHESLKYFILYCASGFKKYVLS